MKKLCLSPTLRRFLSTIVLAFVAFAAAPVLAQQFNPDLFKPLHWRSIGPFRGGRTRAVAGVPSQPNVFYIAQVNGGVWKTNDYGRSWTPIFDDQPTGSVGCIAVSLSDPNVIYVGSGEGLQRPDLSVGDGLYKSIDAGRTWQHLGLREARQIGAVIVDPGDANRVFVAALGHPYGPNEERGVFRSTDGGRSWTKTLFKDADTGAIDLAFEPGNPSIVYAALWQTRRPPWNTYPPSNGPGSGLYKSIDGGRTWQHLAGHGLPTSPARIGLATSPAKPHRIYALIDSNEATQGGLYRSENSG